MIEYDPLPRALHPARLTFVLGSHGAVDGMCGIPFWLPAASCSRAIFGLQAAPWAAMGLGWTPLLKFSRVAGQQCELRCNAVCNLQVCQCRLVILCLRD